MYGCTKMSIQPENYGLPRCPGGQSAIQLTLAIWQQGLPFTGTSSNDMWPSGGSYMAATNAENRTMAPTKRRIDRRSRQQGGGGTLSLNPNLLL